ncbi:hypothetical protein HYW58_02825 [Candidatus Kaiserbacteria bacterium]|nr:hypothetical protein [Candidatus Kaiserbacteria bacterium]
MNRQIAEKAWVIGIIAVAGIAGLLWWHNIRTIDAKQVAVDERGRSDVSIVLTEAGFEPRYIRINSGTAVTFSTTNHKPFWPASNLHPSHGIYPEFDPRKPIDPYDKWSFTFNKTGTWGFHDHVRSYFNGVIYVE